LSLGGKCRYCKKKISWQYPIVEIATALIFLLILAFSHYALLNIVFLFYVFSVLIIIFVYDLKHYLIPDKVLFPAIIIAFLFRILNLFRISDFGFRIFTGYIAAIIIAAGFFLFIFLISRGKWMGFGDVKLAVLLGLVLGFPNILVGLFLAFLFGAIIGVIIMALKKKGLKSEIPFGPFLIAGTFVALLWGQQIINWYLSLIF
jgi:prepilin signal peptidase PulO-like enzyme (type II secretory pathway)